MFFKAIATLALFETRTLLKPSLKSNNKAYYPTISPSDLYARAKATEEEKQKWDRRNTNQEEVDKFLATGPVVPLFGLTVLEAGQALYNRAVANPATWYGNCGEQANIALYLCIKYGAQPKDLWIITYKRNLFTHSLVMLSDNAKNWPKPTVCDPWMNIACYYDKYSKKADEVLHEWTRQGKRLMCGKLGWPLTGRPNWVEPSNADILGFAKGKFVCVHNANDKPEVNLERT